MVGAVDRRAHQVGHTGIQAGEGFVGVLDVPNCRHQVAVWAGDQPAAFHSEIERVQPIWHDDLVIGPPDALRDDRQIYLLLLGTVGDADPAAEIHNLHLYVESSGDLGG